MDLSGKNLRAVSFPVGGIVNARPLRLKAGDRLDLAPGRKSP